MSSNRTQTSDQAVELPDEAVEAAKQAFERVPEGAQFRERLKQLPEYGEVVVPPVELAREMVQAAAPALRQQGAEEVEADLDLNQLRSELQRLAEGRMTLDGTELLTWAEGWLLTLHGGGTDG